MRVARLKAMAIANALLAQDMDEGKAIRIARAKEWALQHDLPVRDDE